MSCCFIKRSEDQFVEVKFSFEFRGFLEWLFAITYSDISSAKFLQTIFFIKLSSILGLRPGLLKLLLKCFFSESVNVVFFSESVNVVFL